MAGESVTVQLGDVADILTGFPFKSDQYTDDANAPRLLRGDNVAQGKLRWEGVKRWPLSTEVEVSQYQLCDGDVIVAMDRPWIEAGLKYAAVRASDLPALLVQRVARLRGTQRLDTAYLKYLVGSREFTDYVLSVQTGTTIPHISRAQIASFAFRLPPLSDQRASAHILATLDDKIELNHRMSETLEAMARALFTSWFVDCDPVRAKAEGRNTGLPKEIADLFPDSFEDSELGEIPKGWGVGTFNDVVEMLRDQVDPQAFPGESFQHFSLPAYDNGKVAVVELGGEIKSNKFFLPPDVVLMSKLNPTIERVWLVDVGLTGRAIASTEFLVLRPRSPFGIAYTYCLARDPAFRRQVQELVTGTSNSHQRAQAGLVLRLPRALPNQAVARAFERIAAPLLDRVKGLARDSRTMASLRDALLPPLISGKLRTSAPNLVTEEAWHGAN